MLQKLPRDFPVSGLKSQGGLELHADACELKGEGSGRIRPAAGVGDECTKGTHTHREEPPHGRHEGEGARKNPPHSKNAHPRARVAGAPLSTPGHLPILRGGVLRLDFHAPLATDHPNQPLVISRC